MKASILNKSIYCVLLLCHCTATNHASVASASVSTTIKPNRRMTNSLLLCRFRGGEVGRKTEQNDNNNNYSIFNSNISGKKESIIFSSTNMEYRKEKLDICG
mmetsp:Transcript_32458/g.34935  ORF Transcript_32458/g.34935 Transcript_32458/m.34935 type:complete len:102 (-) Transcript_32458:502-807(-)